MLEVSIHSHNPIYIKASADNFGKAFALMSSEEQVSVFRAMVEHMRPHRLQWDCIAIELQRGENRDIAEELSSCLQFALEPV